MKKIIIRSARKAAHVSTKILHKGLFVTTKVEDKATRILSGIDFSIKTDETIPLEKIYYNSLPYITPLNPALPAVGSTSTIVLVIPTLDRKSFSGGTDTAVLIAARLAIKTNRPLRIVQTLKSDQPKPDLISFLTSQGVNFKSDNLRIEDVTGRRYNFYGYISIHPEDIFIVSAWWDAYLTSQLPLQRKFIYLIQDFEPIFYNNSDQYVLAESTYKTDKFIAIHNTKLMYDFMKQRNYSVFNNNEAFYFEPAKSRIETGVVKPKAKGEKKRLFLYGRPHVSRNLFYTALNAVDFAFKSGFLKQEDWELTMAGQDNIPDISLSSGVRIKNQGMMTIDEYLEFSKSIDLAVSLMMAPHPNYPTLEFASIGSAVVTTKYANKIDLSGYSKNIVISDIDVESIAGAIKKASLISYADRISNAENDNISNNWDEALEPLIEKVLKKLKANE